MNRVTLESVQQAMMEAGFFPEKRFSQNFLINEEVVRALVNAAHLTKKDHVLEIGGGTGIVTHALAETGAKVESVEVHSSLVPFLRKRFVSHANVTIIDSDFLKVDLNTLAFTKIVASPPYAISDDIMYKILAHGFERASLVWQLEFVEKILSTPGSGEYHPLSVITQYFYDAEMVQKITPKSFYPVPNHFSAILSLKRNKRKMMPNFELYVSWLRVLFR
ncbi:MAG: 16S rRNA (adenine(1518)-N(6)/adenine(1519)-N(6))-dimethyltransferase RsmA, partial [archaeon]